MTHEQEALLDLLARVQRRQPRTREDDERRLRVLRLKDRGWSSAMIAKAVGLTNTRVSQLLWEIDRDYRASEA